MRKRITFVIYLYFGAECEYFSPPLLRPWGERLLRLCSGLFERDQNKTLISEERERKKTPTTFHTVLLGQRDE